MNQQQNKRKKLPYGFCRTVAEIVGSDQYYVSKVLTDPDMYKGPQAQLIKETARTIQSQQAQLKAAVLANQSQNTAI